MADPSSPPTDDEPSSSEFGEGSTADGDEPSLADLRREVEAKYDFDNFGPADMDEMSLEEWEAVFDPNTWITGPELLDRVSADLERRIADRDVFARLERLDEPDRLVAYSDTGYAVVYTDGSIEGRGTVLRDVKPTVALCSMDDYDVPEPPADSRLPDPMEVPEGTGELGNLMLQIVAGVQVLAGLVLVAMWLVTDLGLIPLVVGLSFLFVGGLVFLMVANARLSDKFRAEEYRNRLRAVGLDSNEPPAFLADADPDDVPPALRDLVPGPDEDAEPDRSDEPGRRNRDRPV